MTQFNPPRRAITRRQFAKATAASALAFNYIPSSVFGANDRINYAGIGVGGKGAGEVKDLDAAGATVVALCDVDHKRAGGTLRKYPSAKVFKDFRVMFDKMGKDIDMVSVSTPDHMHAPATAWAMHLGKHCYTQKPMTHTVYEARYLTELARKTKVATQMGNQAHAGEPIRRAVELIQAGMLGEITQIHAWTNRPIWAQGMTSRPPKQDVPETLDWDLWLGPAPYCDYNKAYLPFSWRGWWDFGTGALGDMACHIMDMPFWACELESPTSVEAVQSGNTPVSPPKWSTITYQFPARTGAMTGKKLPAVEYIWYDGRKGTKQNGPDADIMEGEQHRKWDNVIVGTKGKLFFARKSNTMLTKPNGLLEQFNEKTPKTIQRVRSEDFEFIEACRGGKPALSNFDYAGPLTETVLLGNVAIRAGVKFEWDAKKMKTSDPKADFFLHRKYRKGWSMEMPV